MDRSESGAPRLISLFWSFLKLAPVSFGGGYATFPALEREIVARRKWMNEEDLQNILSLAAAAPGGVAVNASFLIGHRLGGLKGSAAAAIGAIVPTCLIVISLFLLYNHFSDSEKVNAALRGIGWGIVALILYTVIRLGRPSIKDKLTLAIAIASLTLLFLHTNPIWLLIGGAAAGVLATHRKNRCVVHSSQTSQSKAGGDSSYMYFI
ncbi:chromate transporter [Paenibacillus sp. 1011MAR3C5]|uniref:chromate transporter n=1 Tax=Paenibacillus sp. 1011MAR3C5 TaxID=1675787 RepID=UPI000E6D2992|nr:chromate transporter [Paenibacillus sp. 1011MAR3C5]RJE85201.1 chromate transporter [Paenibacillus sp. 1011MAR3C5]